MKTKYFFFWKSATPLTNWHMQDFVHEGIKFNCSEQAMMYHKAILFADTEVAEMIMKADHPKEQKDLGRQVRGFNPEIWDRVKYDLIKSILTSKFSTIKANKNFLKSLKGKQIVESSPYDRVWGIGYRKEEALDHIDDWGENLLGKILTELSEEL
jgi:ribA/ribD-fused uncharacterized protein